MNEQRTDWASVALGSGAELIIGWRPRPSRLDAAAVELSSQVAAEIHAMCAATLDQLAQLSPRPYGGSPYIERGEEYLAVPATQLPRASARAGGQSEDDEAAGLSDLERLIATGGLPTLTREDLREGHYLFYAAVCTTQGSEARIGFVRQTDPHRIAKGGGLVALFGQEGLQHLDDPVFVLESDFDLVVTQQEVAVLRLETFNRMFADLNTLAAAAPSNAKIISQVVRQMDAAAVAALGKAAAARPSLARRLQRLTRPGAAPAVTPDDLYGAMTKHGLDPAEIVSHGTITFSQDKAATFLDLVEQLYYETDFTHEHRRSDRYSPLRP